MWGVLTADRHAKLIVSVGDGLVVVVSQTDTQALYVDADGGGKGSIAKIAGSRISDAGWSIYILLKWHNLSIHFH